MSIVIEQLNYTYSAGSPFQSDALVDINLELPDGLLIGLMGHTGSGKSTLVQHLNGLIKPTSGRIFVQGVEITAKDADKRALRQKVGLVFQYPEYQLFEETVAKDIAYGPHNLGLDAATIAERVDEAMGMVGLDLSLKERSPLDLSGGQRRRVAIAGVLAMRPEILVLDEPTAGLDPRGRDEILGLVRDYHAKTQGMVIMVSHSMDDMARMADLLVVMNHGRVAMQGTPREIFSQSEQLRQIGLGVPAVVRLGDMLRERGVPVPKDVLTIQEMEQALLALYRGEGKA
ncbi:MAG: energy-coupling factor transporter ATPase [Christensenellales bacterium]|jgi:energy-coupling factor transport system ATP-binding protein